MWGIDWEAAHVFVVLFLAILGGLGTIIGLVMRMLARMTRLETTLKPVPKQIARAENRLRVHAAHIRALERGRPEQA